MYIILEYTNTNTNNYTIYSYLFGFQNEIKIVIKIFLLNNYFHY